MIKKLEMKNTGLTKNCLKTVPPDNGEVMEKINEIVETINYLEKVIDNIEKISRRYE